MDQYQIVLLVVVSFFLGVVLDITVWKTSETKQEPDNSQHEYRDRKEIR